MINGKNIAKKMTFTALFAAFICAGCFIKIPINPVPIVIQDMMALLSGLMLGPLWGSIAVLIFLVLGCVGLPVFSGGAGFHLIANGPTGGFLVGYLLGAFTAGLIVELTCRKDKPNWWQWTWISVAAVVSTIVLFISGIIGFKRILPEKTLSAVMTLAVVPYIPGNVIKIAVMIPLTKKIRPILNGYYDSPAE